MAPYWVAYDNRYIFTKPANHLGTARSRSGGRGLSASGHFQLKSDEVWVITIDPQGANSLGIQLSDPWGVAYEYATRTSSLNNAQAQPNADGTYTYVVSQRDPGVYNWLDPEGHAAGMLAIRWQSVPNGGKPEKAIRSAQVMPINNLKKTLPKETKFVTPAQRKSQQTKRYADYQRRVTK